jgi:predicted alpha/beta hydrolase
MTMHVNTAMATSGVQGWSTPTPYDEFIIFCVGNDIARESAFRAWAAENKIGFKNLIGAYKGVTERSFIVNAKNGLSCWQWYAKEESILRLSSMYRADPKTGLMRLYGTRLATLIFIHNKLTPYLDFGHFIQVPRELALSKDAWTLDTTDNTYWITERNLQ